MISRRSRAPYVERQVSIPVTFQIIIAVTATGGLEIQNFSNRGSKNTPLQMRCPNDSHFLVPSSKRLCVCFQGDNAFQATHWYDTTMGFTANPWQACLGGTHWMEMLIKGVENVGFHCCTTQSCPTIHRGSIQHFHALRSASEKA